MTRGERTKFRRGEDGKEVCERGEVPEVQSANVRYKEEQSFADAKKRWRRSHLIRTNYLQRREVNGHQGELRGGLGAIALGNYTGEAHHHGGKYVDFTSRGTVKSNLSLGGGCT